MLVAFDIGGTKTIAAIGLDGEVFGMRNFTTLPRERTRAEIVSRCADETRLLLGERGLSLSDIEAVGISAPGMVDADGRLLFSPVTGWRDCDLAGELLAALGINVPTGKNLPVGIDNDVKACALAEAALSGAKDMLWVTVSTGIGGAIVSNGEIYRGRHNLAGEIGHVKVEFAPNLARRCKCGQLGCVEAHASGAAVSEIVAERAGRDAAFSRKLADDGLTADAKGLAVLAAKGDRDALDIFAEAGKYLGRAFAAAQNLLDLPEIVVGGGMAASLAYMRSAIEAEICAAVIEAAQTVKISATALGYNAALMGALALAEAARRVK